MQVYKNIDQLPMFPNAVITIGTFDGVHLGHVQILKQLIKEAGAVNGTAVLITFYPHPKLVLANGKTALHTLNTPEEKYELLHKNGIDHIVVVNFDKKFAGQSALDYIKHFLVEKCHPHTIIIGYDHRFGNNREGDYHLLEAHEQHFGYRVKEIPERLLQNVIISSTKIREALLSGEIETANDFLGYPYFIRGKVIEGDKLGRTIGYPTANINIEDEHKLVPAYGVYAVEITIGNNPTVYKGMLNIGVRPTVSGTKLAIEVNIFDFDANIYDSTIQIAFFKRLRSETKFNGLDELKAQLGKDRINALAALA